jgi:3-hydroxybutyryl-CoA dehydrogenase
MNVKDIKKVAMIGAGLMGNQIAMQAAISGYTVSCYSRRKETVEHAEQFSKNWFEKQVTKEKMTKEDADAIQGRLTFTTSIEEAATNADIVIEAVADILETKKKVLAEVDRYAPEHTIYASNSSYLVSSRFCDSVRHPENVINLHFFNPALVMKIVEVVKEIGRAHV